MKKSKKIFSSTHIIMLSFLGAILVGTVLLMLPISVADGNPTSFIDAFFTATTSTCVTGLVVVPTVSHWSLFGHAVILLLIQIGGLGIITIMSCFAFFLHKKMGLTDRLLLQDAFNLNTLSGLSSFVKKVVAGTFAIEGLGALLYMAVFVPQFGIKGIWISVFNAVSAFCNAGIDIVSENSLCNYATNPIINIVTSFLIIMGGVGFIVWWDVVRVFKERKNKKIKIFRSLTLHSKIALTTTAFLIISGAVFFFIFEYSNPLTIKDYSLFDKIQVALFQSITTRTAGFASVPQENLSTGSALVSLILMFIGGSPVGTAGGIKTVTITVLLASAMASVKNENNVSIFNRTISSKAVSKAVAVCVTSFFIMLLSTLLLTAVTNAPLIDILYETVSATATVGLTRNLTAFLNTAGKIIIIFTMFFGRVGPISLAVALNLKKDNKNIIKNPTEDISIG